MSYRNQNMVQIELRGEPHLKPMPYHRAVVIMNGMYRRGTPIEDLDIISRETGRYVSFVLPG
jgi:hypothetical protein